MSYLLPHSLAVILVSSEGRHHIYQPAGPGLHVRMEPAVEGAMLLHQLVAVCTVHSAREALVHWMQGDSDQPSPFPWLVWPYLIQSDSLILWSPL